MFWWAELNDRKHFLYTQKSNFFEILFPKLSKPLLASASPSQLTGWTSERNGSFVCIEIVFYLWVQLIKNGSKNKNCVYVFVQYMCMYVYIWGIYGCVLVQLVNSTVCNIHHLNIIVTILSIRPSIHPSRYSIIPFYSFGGVLWFSCLTVFLPKGLSY